MKLVKLGYEVGTGKEFHVSQTHTVVTGLTNQSGKTTCLETMALGSDLKSIVFKTKPGEAVFTNGNKLPPYFAEQSNWQYVEALLEATMKERMKFERSWIIKASKNTRTLRQVYENCKELEKTSKGLQQSVYSTLVAYFELVLPELDSINFSPVLDIKPGINIIDLEGISEQVQSLIIRSVLEVLAKLEKNTICIIPEAWLFIPQERGNPVKLAAEYYIRQGATKKNWLFFDSQDLASIDKAILKQVSTYILGLQLERNEVAHSLDQIPLPRKLKPTEDEIMSLTKGQFIVCTPGKVTKVYVQPHNMDNETAIKIAKGEMSVDDWVPPSVKHEDVSRFTEPRIFKVPEPSMDGTALISLETKLANLKDGFDSFVSTTNAQINLLKQAKPQNIDLNAIINEVLKKIPVSAGGVTYSLTAPEKLKQDWQEETKQKILSDIQALDDNAKRMLKYLQSIGKGAKAGELIDKCFFMKSGESSSNKVKQSFLQLESAQLSHKDKNSVYYGDLKTRIFNLLANHETEQQDIDHLYTHIVYELLAKPELVA